MKLVVEEQNEEYTFNNHLDDDDDDDEDASEESGGEEEEEEDDEEEEEEMVDPLVVVREKCMEKGMCKKWNDELKKCTERVNSKENTTETCTYELFHMLHHRDVCVAGKFQQI